MKVHASVMLRKDEEEYRSQQQQEQLVLPYTVLNVGFGMGIIDTALQDIGPPYQHHIIEAHPDVYQKMVRDGWTTRRQGVHVHFGKWQDVIPKLIEQGLQMDAIFFDTYAEHAHDMEDFHRLCFSSAPETANTPQSPPEKNRLPLLKQPHGIYTFFNGLAPDNLFFHGVACNVIKLQLSRMGLDSEFLTCQMEAPDSLAIWQDVRRRYWHGRDIYYLPKVTWNKEFLGLKNKSRDHHDANDKTVPEDTDMILDDDNDCQDTKRQRMAT